MKRKTYKPKNFVEFESAHEGRIFVNPKLVFLVKRNSFCEPARSILILSSGDELEVMGSLEQTLWKLDS